jgi:hypothetical protein
MATIKKSKNMTSLVEAVNSFVSGFFQDQEQYASKGKIKLEDLAEAFTSEAVQEKLVELVKKNMPRQSHKHRLVDPEAPKKPLSGFFIYKAEKMEKFKKANPGMKITEISKALGAQWRELSDEKKAKYVEKTKEAKEEYKEAMKDYTRPSDEELLKLSVNQKKRRSKGEGSAKKKKRDPAAPKAAGSAYQFFASEMRKTIKEEEPKFAEKGMGIKLMKEIARRWNEDYTTEQDRKRWEKMAKKDKARYLEEIKSYVPTEEEEEPVEEKKSRKSKKTKVEEPVEEVKSSKKSSKKVVQEPEEEVVTKKSSSSKKSAKKVVVEFTPEPEEVQDEDAETEDENAEDDE